MKCYRYLNRKFGFRSLNTTSYKLSFPREFNDPFDCAGGFTGTVSNQYFSDYLLNIKEVKYGISGFEENESMGLSPRGSTRQFIANLKETYKRGLILRHLKRMDFNDSTLILCTSRTEEGRSESFAEDALLWAQYAECGHGLRIGIEIGPDICPNIFEVKYSTRMPTVKLSNLTIDWTAEPYKEHPKVEFLGRCIQTKSKAWEYEREVRLAYLSSDPTLVRDKRGLFFVIIPPQYIWRVDFGHLAFENDEKFLRKVHQLKKIGYTNTEFRFAAMDQRRYGYRYRSEKEVEASVKRQKEREKTRSFLAKFPIPFQQSDRPNV